jgi:sensor histidine kinase YesM
MKRFFSVLQPLFMGGGFLLFFILFAHTWQTKPVLSFMRPHPIYFMGIVLLVAIIAIVLFGIKDLKKLRSLPEKERKAFILKSKKKVRKKFRFTLLALVSFIAIILFYLFFIRESSFPVWLKMDFPYIVTIPFLIALSVNNYVVDISDERKLQQSIQEKESVNLKLRSIRSQLNPHFMFNALTSIQGLMNKNDIPAANHYLALFANLTRNVLNTSDQDLISLEDELKIQEDYLQMEQLRFGFQYNVKVGEDINIANTEIPAMLLQPFVENAVKHGVASMQQNGSIQVQVDKQGNNLVLSVTDNGKGFDKEQVTQQKGSLGLKLSEERIALLNQVNPDQPAILSIDLKQTGTTIAITLINLFS